jgi:hypothetical protein
VPVLFDQLVPGFALIDLMREEQQSRRRGWIAKIRIHRLEHRCVHLVPLVDDDETFGVRLGKKSGQSVYRFQKSLRRKMVAFETVRVKRFRVGIFQKVLANTLENLGRLKDLLTDHRVKRLRDSYVELFENKLCIRHHLK